MVGADPLVGDAGELPDGRFTVRLDNFTGPFDLLLQLIGKHKLDVTEVALHQVTDDFIAYIRAMGDDWDLGEASEFLLVAATLLDLKAARLLPAAEVEDEEDLALLESRDLLFARLLQYKAFKEAAAHLAELETMGARRWPRAVSLEPRYAEALPDLVLGIGAQRLFKLALKQFTPKPPPPQFSIVHLHQMRVSVREHANLIRDRLRRAGTATFDLLTADCEGTLEVVARFLALLELYREGLIEFEQPVSLDELTVRWIGGDDDGGELDIDDYEGTPAPRDSDTPPPDAESADADFEHAEVDAAGSDDALPGGAFPGGVGYEGVDSGEAGYDGVVSGGAGYDGVVSGEAGYDGVGADDAPPDGVGPGLRRLDADSEPDRDADVSALEERP
jgi:segregation and condensation protein A